MVVIKECGVNFLIVYVSGYLTIGFGDEIRIFVTVKYAISVYRDLLPHL